MNISSIFPAYEAYENYSEGYRKIIEADDALVGVKYGQLDIYTKKLIKGKVSDDAILVCKPDQLMKYKVGTCWDQSLYTYARLKKDLGTANVRAIGYAYTDTHNRLTTHTTIIAKDKKDYYWTEHAWYEQQGVHGPYKSVDIITREIKSYLPKNSKIFIWKDNLNAVYDKLLAQSKDISAKQFATEVFNFK